MTRSLFLAVALGAAACGTVKDRGECATSADCTPGEYCAHTPDGSVCWGDAVAPTVGPVTVACGVGSSGVGGCVRDGKLVVTADATDDKEVYAVEATVDFDAAHPFALAHVAGNEWTGTIDLAALDFPALSSAAVVTVRVLDGARNEATQDAATAVTRVRWAYSSSGQLTPPAVTTEGTILFGRSDTASQLVAVKPAGTLAWSLSVGTGTVTQPPSIGAEAIWVGANDGKLYAVKLDGSGELAGRSCTASGVAKGPPAILTTAGVDVAFGAFANGRISASTRTSCAQTPLRDPFSSGAAVDIGGDVVAVTTATGVSSLRRFGWDGAAFEELWSVAVGGTVEVTPAFDLLGRIVTGGQDGGLDLTTTAGVTAALPTLGGSIAESPVILAGGDVVVGDASGKLHRIASDGTAVWSTPVDLGAPVHAPMALRDGTARWFLVATADGKLHALDDAGALLWEGPLTAGMALGAGNLHTPAGSATSTAYFGGADGKLYAVAVEGGLDTTAPWPKAWHDARNTSRAGGGF
jgi:hypothetical protein